jgi:hypothetical protein
MQKIIPKLPKEVRKALPVSQGTSRDTLLPAPRSGVPALSSSPAPKPSAPAPGY